MLRKLTPFLAGMTGLGLLGILGGLMWQGSQAAPRPREAGKLEDSIEMTPLRSVPLARREATAVPIPAVRVGGDEAPRVKTQRVATPRPEPQPAPDPQPQLQLQPQPPPRRPAPPPPPPRPEPPPPAPEPHPEPSGPIDLPEAATPPRPDAGNRGPEFPEAARARGLEGEVILKIVVLPSGAVGGVEVLRGGEPFASAARDAVKSWRYTPAILEGRRTVPFPTLAWTSLGLAQRA